MEKVISIYRRRASGLRMSLAGLALALVCFGILLAGCTTETRVTSSTWDKFDRELGDPKPTRSDVDPSDPRVRSPRGYAVELARFSGPDAKQRAFELSTRLREQANLADLWTTDGSSQSIVYLGRFRNPNTPAARNAQAIARQAEVDGMRAFAEAELVALSGTDATDLPELDVRNHTGQYVLQIAYFDLAFGPAYRKAAEDRAQQLRDEGKPAYYYHGPNRSLVALGPFTYNEAFIRSGQVDVYTPRVLQMQEEHPYNIRNGIRPTEQLPAESLGLTESFLVLVR